jgi:2-dehydro-3-deoxyglucarate aldolase
VLSGRPTIGSWLQLADPSLTEMMATAGFDWLVIDLEHTATSTSQMAEVIRIGDLAGCPMLVRLSGHDPAQLKRALDAGARGAVVPMVNSADQAARMAMAARYPPQGDRGVGLARAQGYGLGFDDYRDGGADDVVVIAQIEHIDGVANLDAIVATDGIDGFFVGPYDLSGSLGQPGRFDHPDVAAALDQVASRITPAGPVAGIHVVEPDEAKLKAAVDAGYRFVAFASEMLIFSHRLRAIGETLTAVR